MWSACRKSARNGRRGCGEEFSQSGRTCWPNGPQFGCAPISPRPGARTASIGETTTSHAGTRPPKNGIRARLSVCGRPDVKTISAPAVSASRRAARADPQRAGQSRARDRSSPPAMARAPPGGPSAAGNGCRPAPRCRCAPGIVALPDKTWRELGRDIEVADLDAAQCRLRQRGEFARAHQRHLAALREIPDQRPGVFALHGALGAEHRDAFCPRLGAGRLDRRHRADERYL